METYRGWALKGGKLHSWTSHGNDAWDGTTKTAMCMHGCEVGFCLEHHTCACGIYSRKDLSVLLHEYPNMDIYGIVYNHGVVFEGQSGVRSEKVTIRALFTADFVLGGILEKNYPGVAIMMPPPEILALKKRTEREYDWQGAMARKYQHIEALKKALEEAKAKYPGGFKEEQDRLAKCLKNYNRPSLIEFAKEYVADEEWAARVHGGKIETRTRKAKAGDMVFEANNTLHPYVFVGSCRPNKDQSMRYLLDRNGVLVRRPNIRKWDEEPELMEARKQAIEEWE